MKKFLIGSIFLGLASLGHAQSSDCNKNETKLSSVEVSPTNQVYLNEVSDEAISSIVYTLERKASRYNITEHPSYNANYNYEYCIGFGAGKSKIVATYDQNGKIVSAKESFKDIVTPVVVRNSAYEKYPDWIVQSTAYTVYYNGKKAKKTYMVRMEKDGVKKKLNFDLEGNMEE